MISTNGSSVDDLMDLMVSQHELALNCIQRTNANSSTLLLTVIQQMRCIYG